MSAAAKWTPGDWRSLSRQDAANVRAGSTRDVYGTVERVTATGRATCRECAERIAKGAPSLRFGWDFHGSGSYTAITVHLHAEPCALRSAGVEP